ncbi:hypothetical protein Tco_0189548 [Tanacetum coccineum]
MVRATDGQERDDSLYFMESNYGFYWYKSNGVRPMHQGTMIEIGRFTLALADAAQSVRDAIGFKYCLASSSGWTKERMIQTLEDTLRACVTDFGGSYQLSIQCAPFEALYGRKCRSPVLWAEIGESSLIGPNWFKK